MNSFSIVVLMCLATGASAGLFSRGPDFDGLNNFLVGKQLKLQTI